MTRISTIVINNYLATNVTTNKKRKITKKNKQNSTMSKGYQTKQTKTQSE